ncbi:hypothetical protein OAU26_03685 [Mariniblastus sp.]|nr:hypothetical protein [Mariniblastus sp.]
MTDAVSNQAGILLKQWVTGEANTYVPDCNIVNNMIDELKFQDMHTLKHLLFILTHREEISWLPDEETVVAGGEGKEKEDEHEHPFHTYEFKIKGESKILNPQIIQMALQMRETERINDSDGAVFPRVLDVLEAELCKNIKDIIKRRVRAERDTGNDDDDDLLLQSKPIAINLLSEAPQVAKQTAAAMNEPTPQIQEEAIKMSKKKRRARGKVIKVV